MRIDWSRSCRAAFDNNVAVVRGVRRDRAAFVALPADTPDGEIVGRAGPLLEAKFAAGETYPFLPPSGPEYRLRIDGSRVVLDEVRVTPTE